LALLAIVPLLATVPLAGATAAELYRAAALANSTAATVRQAQVVGALARALQKERLFAVGLLTGQSTSDELQLAQTATDSDGLAVTRLGLPDVDTVVTGQSLSDLRRQISARSVAPATIITAYSGLAIAMIDSVHLLDAVNGGTVEGRQVLALDGVMRANEGFTTLLSTLAAAGTPDVGAAVITGLVALRPAAARFLEYASEDESTLYAIQGQAADARLGDSFRAITTASPGTQVGGPASPPPFATLASLTSTTSTVESKIVEDALAATANSARLDLTRAIVFVSGALLNIVIVAILGARVSRSVSMPVRELTLSAERVANLAEAELIRVADDDTLDTSPPRLEPIVASGRDELSAFAQAFGRVQETAARLVERQVASRRNVALMFRHVGRRTQNLVGRQISLIDRLEAAETDANRLSELYQLDHISSRLRRNASSLVVLSGATTSDERVAPLGVEDIVRLGLAEIENYTRIEIDVRTDVRVLPPLINDLVLLVAELMENATSYSPPGTRVFVAAESTSDGLIIRVIDHGLGMKPQKIEAENARLTRRERLDLAPTEVLGLFVVGRLARRHGLSVTLSTTPGGGVTATVFVPTGLLAHQPAAAVPGPRSGAAPASRAPSWTLTVDLSALDRAARTMREVRPWDAFGVAEPAGAPTTTAAATLDRFGEDPPGPLRRRVPGATLDNLGGTRPRRSSPMAPPSPDAARDSLADFESGIARAIRDLTPHDGGPR
jgi:signal transduction histidine kinase